LRKSPGERYESARDLADELGRFQRNEIVDANPVGFLVRLGKWFKRRPLVAGLSAAVAGSLLLGAIVATFFAVLAHQQAERYKQGRDVLLGSALERTLEVQDLLNRGEVEKAIEVSQKLLDTVQEVYDIYPADQKVRASLAEVLGRLGWAELLAGQFEQALAHIDEAMQYAPEREDIGINLAHAYLLTNAYPQAEKLYRKYRDTRFYKDKKTCAEVVKEDFQEFQQRKLGGIRAQANMRKIQDLLEKRAE
jgi:tetratricopeptide (TPR) repeat protein